MQGHDNDSYMMSTKNESKCFKYSSAYESGIFDPNFRLRKKLDYSTTYDGFTIVSERFVSLCKNKNVHGVEFSILTSEKAHFIMYINSIVEFDAQLRGTRFINYSSECNGYEEIIGATPVFLKQNTPLNPLGFYRSDICFGSFHSKAPLFFCGNGIADVLQRERFKGLVIQPFHNH